MTSTKYLARAFLTFYLFFLLNQVNADIVSSRVETLIEIESLSSKFEEESESNSLYVAAIELKFSNELNDNASLTLQLLYEEDDTPLEVDIATIRVKALENTYIDAGKMYVPFAVLASSHISDPLTLEVAETRETAVLLQHQKKQFTIDTYIFSRQQQSKNNEYGLNLSYAAEDSNLFFSAAYISSLLFEDPENADFISLPALSAFGQFSLGRFSFHAETISTLESYDGSLDKFQPVSFNIETRYTFENESLFALGFQTLDDAEYLELPDTKILVSYAFPPIHQIVEFKAEYSHDTLEREDAPDQSANALTFQLSMSL